MKRICIAAALLAAASGAAGSWPDRRAGASRISLAHAIAIALRAVPGEALRAEIMLEDGEAVIEVDVFARGRMVDVDIDGETGRVLEVEEEEEDELPRGPST
jgi:uncharacterized membrane protein YkoI